jgi:hypothetical protein
MPELLKNIIVKIGVRMRVEPAAHIIRKRMAKRRGDGLLSADARHRGDDIAGRVGWGMGAHSITVKNTDVASVSAPMKM